MNTVWSTCIQNIGTLYSSRSLRFADLFKESYLRAFALADPRDILEIGCGPGALAESLHRWYPNARICGVDRDSNFIAFARENTSGIRFQEEDATELSFEGDSFDVVISNTVSEHIAPAGFFGEQYRVLKEKGVCLVLSSRKGIHVPAPCVAEETEFEQELWRRTGDCFREAFENNKVCEYPLNEAQLPACMERYGFRDVASTYVSVNLTPDDPVYSREMAYAMINANRQNDLDNAEKMLYIAPGMVTPEEVAELKRLINARYDQRLYLYDRGIRQWDTDVAVIQVVRGEK